MNSRRQQNRLSHAMMIVPLLVQLFKKIFLVLEQFSVSLLQISFTLHLAHHVFCQRLKTNKNLQTTCSKMIMLMSGSSIKEDYTDSQILAVGLLPRISSNLMTSIIIKQKASTNGHFK